MNLLYVVIFFTVLVLMFKIKASKKVLNLPPSPPKLPIIGNLHQLTAHPHKSLTTLSIKPFFTAVDVLFNGCLSLGFGPYCDHLKEAKKLCVHQLFNQRRVQQFHFIRKEEAAKFLEKIHNLSINGSAFNISRRFTALAHNILSRSVFGCLYDENEEGTKTSFGEMSRRTLNLVGKFCFKDLFPILGWIAHLTGLMRNLKNTSEEINEFLDRVIEDRLALMNDDDKLEDKKYLVDTLLYLRKEGVELDLSKHSLKALLKDMFMAGVESVSVSMEWMMAELMKNPRIRRKAQEEVRRLMGEKKSEISLADIKEMRYLKCVVKENMRLHAAGLMAREASASVKLQGYDIPPKARVLFNVYAIQRDPKLWDRPEEFVPERFLNGYDSDGDGDGDFNRNNGQNQQVVALSFGVGRRACPGMGYAYAQIEYVLANLLYWFDWELADGSSEVDLDMSEVYTLNISKKTPLWVVAHYHCWKY